MPGRKGFFVTLEGIDGTGKSTQAKLLAEGLRKRGLPVLLTREPGGTVLAEKIRVLLLKEEEKPVPLAELLLYAGARAQHVAEVIRPALREGTVVVCERFFDSTLAYQGYGLGLNLASIREINRIATGGLAPDLTFLLVLEVEEVSPRIRRRNPHNGQDRVEARGAGFLERVHRGYLALARAAPGRIKTIRCSGKTIREIQELLLAGCVQKLEERG